MADVFVVMIWFNRDPQTNFDVEAVIGKSLDAAKQHISERYEQGRELVWHDGRTFSACEQIEPTRHYYTIHTVPMVVYS